MGHAPATDGPKLVSMSSGLRELRVWQEAVSLAGDVIRSLRASARRETKAVSDGIMLTALSIGSHIADGFAHPSAVEQKESYLAAKRALFRLESELAVARHAELMPAGALSDLAARSSQVARLLTGYLVYLDRQIAERDAPAAAASGTPAGGASRDSVRVPA
jgi:four helix bundle protein